MASYIDAIDCLGLGQSALVIQLLVLALRNEHVGAGVHLE